MNSDMLFYLQRDDIGKVIAKGLADVYTNKPDTPVKYLAHWLKAYSQNMKEHTRLVHVEHYKLQQSIIFYKNVEVDKAEHDKAEQHKIHHENQINNFKQLVISHAYQEELLEEQLPEFIQKELNLTGVYVGYLNHPTQEITENDTDQDAHLNTSIPKLINYVGTSKSHKHLMRGNTLILEKGVTNAAFSLTLDDSPPQYNQDGSEIPQEKKQKYVYIPNVVKNENLHYFRLPKLGAYIAIPLIYNSYLKENIFDAALQSRKKYLERLNQFNKINDDQLKVLQIERDEHQHKVTQLTEKQAEKGLIVSSKAELEESLQKIEAKRQEKYQKQQVELPTEKREFVVCADTLGADRQIPEKDRQFLVELIKHFRDNWQKQQYSLLYRDVDYQISIQKQLQKSAEAYIEHLDKCIQITAQAKAVFDQIDDQNVRQYKQAQWELNTLQQQLKNKHQFSNNFIKLKQFRILKFKQLVQFILYFLKLQKKQINLPGKTALDWKNIKISKINQQIFNAVLDYNYQGPKNSHYPEYCKITYLSQELDKFNELQIFSYNIGLGSLLKYIKKALKHRVSNIELRKTQKQNARTQRIALLEDNENITQQKRQALDKYKVSLAPDDVESFKEQQWQAEYDEQYPLNEIPEEIIDDIDNDL